MDGMLKVFSGNVHPALAQSICDSLGIELGKVTVGRFADEEVRIDDLEHVRGCDVFLVQPTTSYGPVGHASFMELLLLIDACHRASADRITAVIPYFGYGRQDRKDRPRVPISAAVVAKAIEVAGADRLLSVDLHSGAIAGFVGIPFDHIYARPYLIDHLRSLELAALTVSATDLGSSKYARSWAWRFDQKRVVLVDKDRIDDETVEIAQILGNVKDRDVILVDDEISSAGTVVTAADDIMSHGARSVRAVATHGKFIGRAIERIDASPLVEVIVTDTLPLPNPLPSKKIKVVSVGPLIGGVISDIHDNSSMNRRFD